MTSDDNHLWLPLEIRNALQQAEAKEFILSLDIDWNNFPLVSHYAPASLMDADPYVFYQPGVLVCSGGTFNDLELKSPRPLIVEGDLIVDGIFENNCHVLVTGNLICRSLVNASRNYLIVMGDLKATGLVGGDEGYGTYVVGDADIERAVFVWNHHMGVAGKFRCANQSHNECDSEQEVIEALSEWGHAYPCEVIDLISITDSLKTLKMPS